MPDSQFASDDNRPHFDAAFLRAIAQDHHAAALRGLAKMADALAGQAVQQREAGFRAADAIGALERNVAALQQQITVLTAERDGLKDIVTERDGALARLEASLAVRSLDRDNALAALRGARAAEVQQDAQLAELRAQLAACTAELDTERNGRAAAEAVIEDIRARQAAARKAGKTKTARNAA